MSASLGLFVRNTKGLSMVAGEWRGAVTLARVRNGQGLLVLSLHNDLSRVASWTVVGLRLLLLQIQLQNNLDKEWTELPIADLKKKLT